MAASAFDGERRVISVTNGFESKTKRSQGSSRLITWSFREFTNIKLFSKDEAVGEVKVPGSNESLSSLSVKDDVIITVPKAKKSSIENYIVINENIKFPISKGQQIGQLKVTVPNEEEESYNLYATNDIKRDQIFLLDFSITFII